MQPNCHRIAGVGSTLGPDLSEIGKKYTRAQILESILEPSKFIDPKYVTYLVETTDGKVLTGLLAAKTDNEVVLRTAGRRQGDSLGRPRWSSRWCRSKNR